MVNGEHSALRPVESLSGWELVYPAFTEQSCGAGPMTEEQPVLVAGRAFTAEGALRLGISATGARCQRVRPRTPISPAAAIWPRAARPSVLDRAPYYVRSSSSSSPGSPSGSGHHACRRARAKSTRGRRQPCGVGRTPSQASPEGPRFLDAPPPSVADRFRVRRLLSPSPSVSSTAGRRRSVSARPASSSVVRRCTRVASLQ